MLVFFRRPWHYSGNGRLGQRRLILQPSPAVFAVVPGGMKLFLRLRIRLSQNGRRRQPDSLAGPAPTKALLQRRRTAHPRGGAICRSSRYRGQVRGRRLPIVDDAITPLCTYSKHGIMTLSLPADAFGSANQEERDPRVGRTQAGGWVRLRGTARV